jgi:hypothetical protein
MTLNAILSGTSIVCPTSSMRSFWLDIKKDLYCMHEIISTYVLALMWAP